jgi:molybdopterin converting factor small subunit
MSCDALMKVKVNFLGVLSNYTGVETVEIELRDGACYGDLLVEIAKRYGAKLPERCWDPEKNEFRKPFSAIGSKGDIEERDAPLAGHEEIHFLMPVSGGAH